MQSFLLHLHSGWAYVVVLLTLVLLVMVLMSFFSKKPVTAGLRKISFYTTLAFHIQFLVGIGLYLVSPIVQNSWQAGTAMQTGPRLYTLEHPLMMFTAVILITIANAQIKRATVLRPATLIFLVLALLCFYMIPWTAWLNL
ncbi:MAG: hypothetical protein Q4F57_06470 [Weeksellaceae bacterium]|nr:hypothetical protein [Weeksellaceae bacterium]